MLRILLLLFPVYTSALSQKSCEKIAISDIKRELVRDSLNQIKVLLPNCIEENEDVEACSRRSTAAAYVTLIGELLDGIQIIGNETKVRPENPDPKVGDGGPIDCQDILKSGQKKSGVYTIYPRHFEKGSRGLKVYCDMDTEGGGWTVFHRRGNYSTQTDFYRDWDSYKKGFGVLEKDFWLGNENIFTISNQGVYSLRYEVLQVNTHFKYGEHEIFFITDEESGYSLFIQGFTGNSTNDMPSQHLAKFSTKDRPHAGFQGNELCPEIMHGAWWYPKSCGHVNLNGLYMPGVDNRNSNWFANLSGIRGVLTSEMKIRRRNFKAVQE